MTPRSVEYANDVRWRIFIWVQSNTYHRNMQAVALRQIWSFFDLISRSISSWWGCGWRCHVAVQRQIGSNTDKHQPEVFRWQVNYVFSKCTLGLVLAVHNSKKKSFVTVQKCHSRAWRHKPLKITTRSSLSDLDGLVTPITYTKHSIGS